MAIDYMARNQMLAGLVGNVAGMIRGRMQKNEMKTAMEGTDFAKNPVEGYNKLAQYYTSQGDYAQAAKAVEAARQHQMLSLQQTAEERRGQMQAKELETYDEKAAVDLAYKRALTDNAKAQAQAMGAKATTTPFAKMMQGVQQAQAVINNPQSAPAERSAAQAWVDKAKGLVAPKPKELIPTKQELAQVAGTVTRANIFGRKAGEALDEEGLGTLTAIVANDAKQLLLDKKAKNWDEAQQIALENVVSSGMLSLSHADLFSPSTWMGPDITVNQAAILPGQAPAAPMQGTGQKVLVGHGKTSNKAIYQNPDGTMEYEDGTPYGG